MTKLNADTLTEREFEILSRFALRQSNREIAEALFLTVGTVKWYAQQIFNKLGASNRTEAVALATAKGLFKREDEPAAPAGNPNNLPAALTSFIGREREMMHIQMLLEMSRLVTLVGPGGAGKTRLAIRTAWHLLGHYPDGVFFVDLVPLTDASFVPREIARVLGVRELANQPLVTSLQAHLRHRSLLLILDNFEHVMDAALLVPELLEAAPGLRILVTSREVLRVTGEQEMVIPPLELPLSGRVSGLDALLDYEAVALFVQRARAVRPEFALTEENAPAIVEICTRLDALPLAIELAAARIKLFTPQAMLNRLDDRMNMLAGGPRDTSERHRAIRPAIEWSYALLNDDEKRLFEQVAIFFGGARLEAVEAVCAFDQPIDLLTTILSLVDKSLLQQRHDQDGEPRFWMLETIREYALARLLENGLLDAARERHALHYTDLASRAAPEMNRRNHKHWYNRLEQDNGNLRAAVDWLLVTRQCEAVAKIARALYLFWLRTRPVEGFAWLRRVLATCDESIKALNDVYIMTARIGFIIGETAIGRRYAEQALERGRAMNDQVTIGHALGALAIHDIYELPLERIEAMFMEALTYFERGGGLDGQAWVNSALGVAATVRGAYEQSARYHEQAMALYQSNENGSGVAGVHQNIGLNDLYRGDYAAAARRFRENLIFQHSNGTLDGTANALIGFSGIACGHGDYLLALRYAEAVIRIRKEYGIELDYPERELVDRYLAECHDKLGSSFESHWAHWQSVPLEDTIQLALLPQQDEHDNRDKGLQPLV